jgi:hypothetical protein
MFLPDCSSRSVHGYTPEQRHLNEDQLYIAGLYVMRFALADQPAGEETAIFPARAEDIDLWKQGTYHISMSILDADFQEQSSGWAVFRDGESRLIGGLAVGQAPVRACYFEKPYVSAFDAQATPLLSDRSEIEEY